MPMFNFQHQGGGVQVGVGAKSWWHEIVFYLNKNDQVVETLPWKSHIYALGSALILDVVLLYFDFHNKIKNQHLLSTEKPRNLPCI